MKQRASIFSEDDDDLSEKAPESAKELDLSDFAPKPVSSVKGLGPPAEQVRAISEASSFRSREPMPNADQQHKRVGKRPTGRTAHFATRILPPAYEAFYAIAESKKWTVGITVEKALKALIKEENISLEQLKVHLNLNLLGYDPDKKQTW